MQEIEGVRVCELNLRGLMSPLPLLSLKKTVNNTACDELRVVTTDPSSVNDFIAYSRDKHFFTTYTTINKEFYFTIKME
ncbi:MAG: sulfurtransferase TusA family protein [Cellvibrionaceae bacterium]|nr:sulfurtransferase TusA family protein [Cellvibrionaceae bacterium]